MTARNARKARTSASSASSPRSGGRKKAPTRRRAAAATDVTNNVVNLESALKKSTATASGGREAGRRLLQPSGPDMLPDRDKLRVKDADAFVLPEIAKITGAKPTHKRLKIGDLRVDSFVQRSCTNAEVMKIARKFLPSAVGVIYISEREDGTFHVMDGQRRVKAMLFHGMDNTSTPCIVWKHLNRKQEAQLFRLFNDHRKCTGFDMFRTGLIAEDQDCVAIDRIASERSIEISHNSGDGSANCVGALMKSYRLDDGKALRFALDTIIDVWGLNSKALSGSIIFGLAVFYDHYNECFTDPSDAKFIRLNSQFVKNLKRRSGGVVKFDNDARSLREVAGGGTISDAVAQLVINSFNRGRKTRKLAAL